MISKGSKEQIRYLQSTFVELTEPFMASRGFVNTRHSSEFVRVVKKTTQSVDLNFTLNPPDETDSLICVYPMMTVVHSDVQSIVEDIVAGDMRILSGVTRAQTFQPIEINAMKKESARWFIKNEAESKNRNYLLRDFFDKWTLPFLDNYTTREDFIKAHLSKDSRVLRDRAEIVKIISTLVSLERYVDAKNLIESEFSSIGLRKQYSQVFEYIHKRVN